MARVADPPAVSGVEVDVQRRYDPGHRIADGVAATAGKEQADRASCRVPRPDARAGVTACAEVPAVALHHELAGEPGLADAVVDPAGPVEGHDAPCRQLSRSASLADVPTELRVERCVRDSEVVGGAAGEVDELAADAVGPGPPGRTIDVVGRSAHGDRDEALENRDLVGRAAAAVVRTRLGDAVTEDRVVHVGEDMVVAEDHEPRI